METSIFINLLKTVKNSFKSIDLSKIDQPILIELNDHLNFSDVRLKKYNKIVSWKGDEIHPIYPYALITHLQLAMVNHENFPFKPLGIVHKKEHVQCFAPLKKGEWSAQAKISAYRKVEKGYEIDFETTLMIDSEKTWRSLTTAIMKTSRGIAKKTFKKINVKSDIKFNVPLGLGFKYGLVSGNVDPIHISTPTAKLMGHKASIIHGMWTVGRLISAVAPITYPLDLKVKFISPIYMPAIVQLEKSEEGYGIYSEDGKSLHLLAQITQV